MARDDGAGTAGGSSQCEGRHGACSGAAGGQRGCSTHCMWASLVAQTVKNPPSVQGTWVQSLGQEDPLEKG